MELRFYDKNLNLLGITENQTSLVWTRKFFEPGTFEVYLPITPTNIDLCKLGNIITYRGANDGGVIEDVIMRANNAEKIIIIAGRFLASYMDRRLVRPTLNFSGKVEVAMRRMLTEAVPIPLVQLGALNNFTETVIFQASYKNLLDIQTKLSQGFNIGYRFRPDFTEKKIYFETYKGVDRSREQSQRAFVEFSNKFNNLNSLENRKNDELLKTVAYVGGEGEGAARVYVIVGDNTTTGLERRELFVDAKDLTSNDLTQSEYRETLITRGKEKMKEHELINSYECSTIPTGNYNYRKDYDLGDIVTIRHTDWGFIESKRITEISEIYENGGMSVEPTFGTALPTTINWED